MYRYRKIEKVFLKETLRRTLHQNTTNTIPGLIRITFIKYNYII